MPELLIDSMPMTFSLEEDSQKPGKYMVRGQFAKAGVATENKRVYREHLWRREFTKLNEAMQNRRVYGELDHPADGRTKLQRVSHLITNLHVQGNEVIGEAEILDTPNGRIAKSLAKAKAQVGVSSRGYGSVKTLPDGTHEVQEDFSLHTFDFVADPATKTAYPQVFAEERQYIEEAEVELTLERLKAHYPGLVSELTEQILEGTNGGDNVARAIMEAEQRTEDRLTKRFSEQLRRGVEIIDEEARAAVRSELMSDPSVAGAKQVLEQIVGLVRSYGMDAEAQEELVKKGEEIEELKGKLGDRELELQRYKAESEQMKKLAKEAGYTLHLERLIPDGDTRKAVVALLGDVAQFGSKEELEGKIEAIKTELERRGGPLPTEDDSDATEELQGRVETLEGELETAQQELDKAEKAKKGATERASKAEGQTRKAVEVAEGLELQVYVERELGTFLDRDRDTIRGLCESVTDREEVDSIIKKFVPQRLHDDDEASRIRAAVGRGKTRDLHEDTFGQKEDGPGNGKGGSPLTEVGLDQGEFDRLAGTGSGS